MIGCRWILVVAGEVFDPRAGYFRPCPSSLGHLEPDPDSGPVGPLGDRLHVFRFAGQLLGLLVRLGLPVPAPVHVAALRYLLGESIGPEDLAQVRCG